MFRVVLAFLAILMYPATALAQPAPAKPVAQSAEFAAVRAKFENLTEAQLIAMGYAAPPPVPGTCVTSPLGGMGYHYENRALWSAQFSSGRLDPNNPPLVMLDVNKKVVGIEWEAAASTPEPMLFGQPVTVQPGHPGAPEVNVPHRMLHAYFKPNGMVLFDAFDPDVKCPPLAAAAAPVQLPRTGTFGLGIAFLSGFGLASLGIAFRRLRA